MAARASFGRSSLAFNASSSVFRDRSFYAGARPNDRTSNPRQPHRAATCRRAPRLAGAWRSARLLVKADIIELGERHSGQGGARRRSPPRGSALCAEGDCDGGELARVWTGCGSRCRRLLCCRPAGLGGRRDHDRRAASAHRRPVAGRREAQDGLRALARRAREARRHQRRRREAQGQAGLFRLSVADAARRAIGRKADQQRQGQLPVLAVRLGRDQGRELGGREIRRPDDGLNRVVEGGLRSELQEPVRPLHAQRHAQRADRGPGQSQVPRRHARRHPRPQRPLSVGARRRVQEVGGVPRPAGGLFREIHHRNARPCRRHHPDRGRQARLDRGDRLHQRSHPDPAADGGPEGHARR